jgi:hypothetical protein
LDKIHTLSDAKALSAACLYLNLEKEIINLLYKLVYSLTLGDNKKIQDYTTQLYTYNAQHVYDLIESEFTQKNQNDLKAHLKTDIAKPFQSEQRVWEFQYNTFCSLIKNIYLNRTPNEEMYLKTCTDLKNKYTPAQVLMYLNQYERAKKQEMLKKFETDTYTETKGGKTITKWRASFGFD